MYVYKHNGMLVRREVAESSKCINMTLLFCHGERERERERSTNGSVPGLLKHYPIQIPVTLN